ncbi:hypothetical protein QBC37DRAFT_370013 [Rhypophila decipiens]|uniref:Uncharacterized protein n=1 Tax=Rhypophila decipiens TaxID=261697 RepID=A0AAN6YII3_9PEZI|nr:hypothetical protein QBC37DRAFT_370013 [Rhypophila decipiens]
MKLLTSISLFLLGGSLPATLGATVPISTNANNANNNITTIFKRGADGDIVVQPTYHTLDDRLLSNALNCLATWCDEDHFVRKQGGMVRCRTPGDFGAEVFICNAGEVQRCSSRQLSKAINELRMAGSTTGAVSHDISQGRGLKFGFDFFCKGGNEVCETADREYDAVRKHCASGVFTQVKIQYETVADPTRGLGTDLKFTGWDWVEQPGKEEAPKEYAYGFERVYDEEEEEEEEDYYDEEADPEYYLPPADYDYEVAAPEYYQADGEEAAAPGYYQSVRPSGQGYDDNSWIRRRFTVAGHPAAAGAVSTWTQVTPVIELSRKSSLWGSSASGGVGIGEQSI